MTTKLKSSATFDHNQKSEFVAALEQMASEVRGCIESLEQTAEDAAKLVAQRNALRDALEPVEEFLESISNITIALDYAWVAHMAKELHPAARDALRMVTEG
jgi:hypothetical protein